MNACKLWKTIAIASLGLLCFAGCGIDLQFEYETTPRGVTSVTPDDIVVQVSTAVAVLVMDGDEELESDMTVSMSSQDEDILGVDPTEDFDVFVLYGVSPGQTSVTVRADGDHVATIPAEVVDIN